MLINLLIDKKSKTCINPSSIVISSSISIFVYIFAFCVYFISNYQYGQDYDLEKVVREANSFQVTMVLLFNLFILLFFIYRLKKIIKNKIYVYRFTSNIFKWLLVSLPLLLIDLYYITNVTDRISSKELSSLIIITTVYFLLALQSWTILTCRNKLITILSLSIIIFTGIATFEREPFLFAFFGILIRTISSFNRRSLPILMLSILLLFTSINFFSKTISKAIYTEVEGISDIDYFTDAVEKYRNPILKASGDLATKLSLELVYLSDEFRPNYLKRRLFIPVQLERLFLPMNSTIVTNGQLATERYVDKTNNTSSLGFSYLLDFYISIGILSLIVIPILFSFLFKYTTTSQLNFILIVPCQTWFFKLQRSDIWPSIIPYSLIIILVLIAIILNKNRKYKNI